MGNYNMYENLIGQTIVMIQPNGLRTQNAYTIIISTKRPLMGKPQLTIGNSPKFDADPSRTNISYSGATNPTWTTEFAVTMADADVPTAGPTGIAIVGLWEQGIMIDFLGVDVAVGP